MPDTAQCSCIGSLGHGRGFAGGIAGGYIVLQPGRKAPQQLPSGGKTGNDNAGGKFYARPERQVKQVLCQPGQYEDRYGNDERGRIPTYELDFVSSPQLLGCLDGYSSQR